MNAVAELGRNPVSKHSIQSEYGDEQADVGRDRRTPLARQNSQARTRTKKNQFRCSADHDGNPIRSIHTLAICVTIHTYKDT